MLSKPRGKLLVGLTGVLVDDASANTEDLLTRTRTVKFLYRHVNRQIYLMNLLVVVVNL